MHRLFSIFFSKLVISFCIIMFVPIFLALLFIAAFFRVQWEMMTHNMEVMPDVRGLVLEIAFMIVLVLLLTAAMLMIWIYVIKLKRLRKFLIYSCLKVYILWFWDQILKQQPKFGRLRYLALMLLVCQLFRRSCLLFMPV